MICVYALGPLGTGGGLGAGSVPVVEKARVAPPEDGGDTGAGGRGAGGGCTVGKTGGVGATYTGGSGAGGGSCRGGGRVAGTSVAIGDGPPDNGVPLNVREGFSRVLNKPVKPEDGTSLLGASDAGADRS